MPPKADPVLNTLQGELLESKKQWSDEIKMSKGPKDSPNFPWPVGLTRTIPQPDSPVLIACVKVAAAPLPLAMLGCQPTHACAYVFRAHGVTHGHLSVCMSAHVWHAF